MQLTTKARYAISAMLDLAYNNNKDKPITLDIISQRQNISLSYLEQLFSKLRRASLIKSVRGPGGGYLLDVEAKNISITNIIEAVDENIDLRLCKGKSICNNGKECISHQLWCEVSGQIRGFLDSKSLQQIIDDHKFNKGL